jgi:hypothetical protein
MLLCCAKLAVATLFLLDPIWASSMTMDDDIISIYYVIIYSGEYNRIQIWNIGQEYVILHWSQETY